MAPTLRPPLPTDTVTKCIPIAAPTMTHKYPILGVIGGSSLFHAKEFTSSLQKRVITTDFGNVIAHIGLWKEWELEVVFVQRHHADPDGQYKQPREINFKAIAQAMRIAKCEAVIGIYSVGSMNNEIAVGRIVVPEDYFNPFDILCMSRQYDAHIVPDMHPLLRSSLLSILQSAHYDPYDGGVYIQTAGPRFETKAEVRFFKQFGELIGMTGANEAELMNELRVPFAMLAIVDNLANGIGPHLTLDAFKVAQQSNTEKIQEVVCHVMNQVAECKLIERLRSSSENNTQL